MNTLPRIIIIIISIIIIMNDDELDDHAARPVCLWSSLESIH